jgi:FemAB-related protein (PEP-CTERM system-associated)
MHLAEATAAVKPHSEAARAVSSPGMPTLDVTTLARQWEPKWDEYVIGHEYGTLFHTLAWRDAVKSAYGHEHIYLTAIRGGRIAGVLPLALVASRIAGRMLVSVPYGVAGGSIGDSAEIVNALFGRAKQIADERRCTTIDLRSERATVPSLPVVDRYVGFQRKLPDDPADVLGWLPRKARAAARNARDKYGLTVSFDDANLRKVWHLYSMSMRRLGSLTYPWTFFERLVDSTPGHHWVSLAKSKGRPVAGLVTFLFKDRVMPYFIGSTEEAKRCSAANFIYLTAMERGVEHGYRVFDFGRSRRDNTGSYDFKRFNGFEPRPLKYQYYVSPGSRAANLSPANPRFRVARRLLGGLPLCVTRALGARLAKHIPG